MRLLITWIMCFCLIVWANQTQAGDPKAAVAVAAAVVKARINAQPELPNSIEQSNKPGTGTAAPIEQPDDSPADASEVENPAPASPAPVPVTLTLDPVAAAQITPEPAKVQWLIFTMPNCPPCIKDQQDYLPWLHASGWGADENLDSQIRLVDVYKYPELQQKFGVHGLPTYILVHGEKIIERHNRYPGRQHIADRFIQVKASLPPQAPAGAVTIGTISGGKAAATSAVEWMTSMVGEAGTFEGKWTRGKGASDTIALADGVTLSLPAPLQIRYEVIKANQTVRIVFTGGRPAVRMRVLGILPTQQSISAVKLDTSEIVLELPGMIDPRFKLD